MQSKLALYSEHFVCSWSDFSLGLFLIVTIVYVCVRGCKDALVRVTVLFVCVGFYGWIRWTSKDARLEVY